ncbi:Hypothetical protein ETEE_3184 [Edwardsiella anguillarum ET080813]|uniref:Uncharacterized protein n=1 Tax=Edwardsiella anguillarum ET080813 TaxID=667120 RepID=A0A076LSH6_9GAMM|nr:Hypothetical protein ETEE_3184 [Edwardsiella anguillarum ET080813]
MPTVWLKKTIKWRAGRGIRNKYCKNKRKQHGTERRRRAKKHKKAGPEPCLIGYPWRPVAARD